MNKRKLLLKNRRIFELVFPMLYWAYRFRAFRRRRAIAEMARISTEYIRGKLQQPSFLEVLFPRVSEDELLHDPEPAVPVEVKAHDLATKLTPELKSEIAGICGDIIRERLNAPRIDTVELLRGTLPLPKEPACEPSESESTSPEPEPGQDPS